MLLRHYLGRRLAAYYAQPSHRVVGSLRTDEHDGGVAFSSLWGEAHWRRVHGRLYEEQEGQWLTPVELFRPYYSQVLANFVHQECTRATTSSGSDRPFDIVELGGGRGTNAHLLLSHLKETIPECYNRVQSYTIIDSSPSLLELQQETLGRGPHADKIRLEQMDLLDVAEEKVPFLDASEVPTVVIALEVLDNLPHDKVRKNPRSRLLQQAELQSRDNSSHEEEVFVPLSDPLLSRVLKRVPAYSGALGRPFWVPTVACGVLNELCKVRPNARLVVADFDYLPLPSLMQDDESTSHDARKRRTSEPGDSEPLVTSMDGIDYECYLNAPNEFCDILFPTDFGKLTRFVRKTWGGNDSVTVSTAKQAVFLQDYGPSQVRATQNWLTGYTPLLHDFANCTVLTVSTNEPKVTNDSSAS